MVDMEEPEEVDVKPVIAKDGNESGELSDESDKEDVEVKMEPDAKRHRLRSPSPLFAPRQHGQHRRGSHSPDDSPYKRSAGGRDRDVYYGSPQMERPSVAVAPEQESLHPQQLAERSRMLIANDGPNLTMVPDAALLSLVRAATHLEREYDRLLSSRTKLLGKMSEMRDDELGETRRALRDAEQEAGRHAVPGALDVQAGYVRSVLCRSGALDESSGGGGGGDQLVPPMPPLAPPTRSPEPAAEGRHPYASLGVSSRPPPSLVPPPDLSRPPPMLPNMSLPPPPLGRFDPSRPPPIPSMLGPARVPRMDVPPPPIPATRVNQLVLKMCVSGSGSAASPAPLRPAPSRSPYDARGWRR